MKIPEMPSFEMPADGLEMFCVGDFTFDIVSETSQWEIFEFSKEVSTRIVAKTGEIKKALKAKLIDDDVEDGEIEVYVEFPGIGVYNNGVPQGSFEIKEDKCTSPYAYVRKNGFQYSLDFFGVVTFKDGWVAYNGYLKPPYDSKPVFPVKIYKKFEATTLNWSNYKFTSYEEASAAPAEIVRYLYMQNPEFEELPDRFFDFKNLKELVISCQWPMQKLPLKSLPEKIGTLHQLEQISVNGTQFETLPQSIGQLQNISRFYFNNGQLKSVPDGLFRLPKLEYLMLSGHCLEKLPNEVNLPAIKTLDLADNKLKTVPAHLLLQPHLKRISLEKNPLESLPAAINSIEEVALAIDDKKRLMDFEYRGADGKGTREWNDTLFYTNDDKILQQRVKEIFTELNIDTRYQNALYALAKSSIAFKLGEEEDYTIVGNHRFGGMPDLPAHIAYPEFLEKNEEGAKTFLYEFIAQVNCTDIADLQHYLPRTGMLFFFLETLHNIYNNAGHCACKVIYVENTATLQSGNRFQFSTEDYFEMSEPAYLSNKANAVKEISFPSFYASYVNQYLFKDDAASLKNEDYDNGLFDDLAASGANQRTYRHAINTYGFTQHESPELQASLKLKGNPEDWVILLKVGSTGDFMWGDAGDLFFVIHKSDLAKSDFNNVFVTLESS